MVDKHVTNDEVFTDESDYEQKAVLSIKEVIIRHLRKIGDICCQEFTGGYWDKKPIKTATGIMFAETYHEDVREAYSNAVDFFVDVIYPMGDSILKKYLDEHEKGDDFETETKEKLKKKRITFREINRMFERTNFWQGSDTSNE